MKKYWTLDEMDRREWNRVFDKLQTIIKNKKVTLKDGSQQQAYEDDFGLIKEDENGVWFKYYYTKKAFQVMLMVGDELILQEKEPPE